MSKRHDFTAIRRHGVSWLAVLALAASLGGCVAYPGYGPGYYGYGGYDGYGGYGGYGPYGGPVVAVPVPEVGFGYWGGGGGGGGYWGGGGGGRGYWGGGGGGGGEHGGHGH
jgi:hypothetical protein